MERKYSPDFIVLKTTKGVTCCTENITIPGITSFCKGVKTCTDHLQI